MAGEKGQNRASLKDAARKVRKGNCTAVGFLEIRVQLK